MKKLHIEKNIHTEKQAVEQNTSKFRHYTEEEKKWFATTLEQNKKTIEIARKYEIEISVDEEEEIYCCAIPLNAHNSDYHYCLYINCDRYSNLAKQLWHIIPRLLSGIMTLELSGNGSYMQKELKGAAKLAYERMRFMFIEMFEGDCFPASYAAYNQPMDFMMKEDDCEEHGDNGEECCDDDTAFFELKLDEEAFFEAEQMFHSLGISVDEAVNMFLHQCIIDKGFPYRPHV